MAQVTPSEPLPELSLNDGAKWQTDTHTRESVARMREVINSTPPDALGQALSGEINRLFEGCTLQGEAHNQLHLFLGELLLHVTGLYASEDPVEQAEEKEAISELLLIYGDYFE